MDENKLVNLEDGKRLPYKPKLTASMLPYIRACRGLNQRKFAEEYVGIDQARLSDLETGRIEISEHYEKKIRQAIAKLRISSEELLYISRMVEIRKARGYK